MHEHRDQPTLCCSLDDPRQIQQLDVGSFVLKRKQRVEVKPCAGHLSCLQSLQTAELKESSSGTTLNKAEGSAEVTPECFLLSCLQQTLNFASWPPEGSRDWFDKASGKLHSTRATSPHVSETEKKRKKKCFFGLKSKAL